MMFSMKRILPLSCVHSHHRYLVQWWHAQSVCTRLKAANPFCECAELGLLSVDTRELLHEILLMTNET